MTPSVIEKYLGKHHPISLSSQFPVLENVRIIIVIPCYNEPDVLSTLCSLAKCDRKGFGTEVLLLINSYSFNNDQIKQANRITYQESLDFAFRNNCPDFTLIPLLIEDLPGKQSGAGLPRKTGMDEALIRFHRINRDSGIIVSLDADCTVEKNYLTEIYHRFNQQNLCSATIEFHHPIKQLPENDPVREAIAVYELYLRYYQAALQYCGYPYAYFTIGSALAVTCETYARAGGMGKQQGGEDFYFMQKVFPLGKTQWIDSTRVYPAARLSDRVPFGTGPELIKLVERNHIVKYTYRFEAFQLLKMLFDSVDNFFRISEAEAVKIIQTFPKPVCDFLKEDHFIAKLNEINQNTSTLNAFRKRFFNYFNAFKILKYLNYLHPVYFTPADVKTEYATLKKFISDGMLAPA